MALDRWRSENSGEAWIRSITAEINTRFTPFEIGFLRRCIEGTLFAGLCMKKVERFRDIVPRFKRTHETEILAEGDEDRVVCTFVDGVAARKGIPLSRSGNVR